MKRWGPLLIVLSFIRFSLASFDPYDVTAALLDSKKHPRVLNTVDLPNWIKQDPEPVFNPEGDFNLDGSSDIVISGIYDLEHNPRRYFLLVATTLKETKRFKSIFFEEYETPVFIHLPGTTGEADIGDQSFSISSCWDCDKGHDFYWNKKKKSFESRPWTSRTKSEKKEITVPSEQLPQDTVEAALKIIGLLADIQVYVSDIKKRKGELGTRVEWDKKDAKKRRPTVFIFEKKEGKEIIYDRVVVDLDNKKIIKRTLKVPKRTK